MEAGHRRRSWILVLDLAPSRRVACSLIHSVLSLAPCGLNPRRCLSSLPQSEPAAAGARAAAAAGAPAVLDDTPVPPPDAAKFVGEVWEKTLSAASPPTAGTVQFTSELKGGASPHSDDGS